jgi:hypothetical protein
MTFAAAVFIVWMFVSVCASLLLGALIREGAK